MSRKAFLFLAMTFASLSLFSQTAKNNGSIAPFEITLADGSSFKASQLKKGPVMLVYFSPECDHCRHDKNRSVGRPLRRHERHRTDRKIPAHGTHGRAIRHRQRLPVSGSTAIGIHQRRGQRIGRGEPHRAAGARAQIG